MIKKGVIMVMMVIIGLVTLLASFIGTVTGFGIATTMLPILTFFLPVEKALVFVTIIHWFNDMWKLVLFKKGINLHLIIFFGIPSTFASIIGALLIGNMPLELFHPALGLFLILYVTILLYNPKFEISPSRLNATLGGIFSGFSAGFFGIRGAITSSFLVAYDLSKHIYLATMGAIALMVDSARLTTYFASGMRLSTSMLIGLVVFIPLSFLGAYIGQFFVRLVTRLQLRKIVAVFISLIGVKLVFFG